MARKKVKLAYIINDVTRKATYKKRKNGLLKKVSEISTLCGINACAIIYSPYDSQPEMWPSILGVQSVISQFNRMPEMKKTDKMFNQEAYLKKSIVKLNKKRRKLQMENREKEIKMLMIESLLIGQQRLQTMTLPDLNDLGWMIDQKLLEINNRMETIKNIAPQLQVALPPPPPSQQPLMPVASNQIQPNRMQVVQVQNLVPEWFGDEISHPIENMGCGHGGDDWIFMPFNDNLTIPQPNTLYRSLGIC